LIASFGKYIVRPQLAPAELGGALNKVERLRLLADYTGTPIKPTDARWAVDQAESFVGALRTRFSAKESGSSQDE
jgi:hypothetical protein